jgi:hypothetical protein
MEDIAENLIAYLGGQVKKWRAVIVLWGARICQNCSPSPTEARIHTSCFCSKTEQAFVVVSAYSVARAIVSHIFVHC